MKETTPLERGMQLAQKITRQYAKTYYFASRFMPREKKSPAYIVYAVCRISDEAVDTTSDATLSSLSRAQENIELAYSDSPLQEDLILAFRQTVMRFDIPKTYFDELLEGMRMDLTKKRYETFNDLYSYCYRVAGVIGLTMLKIFGYHQKEAEKYAVDLGVAMQLTNIVRDIKEDFLRGRVYLPQEELKKFGVSEEQLSSEKVDENFKSLLRFQMERARQYYADCESGIRLIADRRCRFVVLCIKEIYAGILDRIEDSNYDVFSKRCLVPSGSKAGIALKILLEGRYL
ncbi:MAG: phytoene/squalene synthase family protein [Candidatus Omnitrophota bacterium]